MVTAGFLLVTTMGALLIVAGFVGRRVVMSEELKKVGAGDERGHDTKGSRKALGAMNAKLRAKVGVLERELAALKQPSAGVDERADGEFDVCGVTVRKSELGGWLYLSEGYGSDEPDTWVTCTDSLGPFSGSGVNTLLSAYVELQARAQLAAPERPPMDMLDLSEIALKASPWAEHAGRTGAFVKGALWHAQLAAPAGVPDGDRNNDSE